MISVSLDKVSKKFVLKHNKPADLANIARRIFTKSPREDFWALKNISFELLEGEALGIVGHNGAGKSTILKLLTHILEPTSGTLRTIGRLSALIEVGAGFHPEMTGRENVYLNGSILGMRKAEIKKKFDEIISFAEIENFIDMPVKRYSSGMYARLGFAVAAHVNPEILLIDEVLSVGDERFQVKCQERMSKLINSGATVIFVSHNYPAVMALCPRCIVLNHGECAYDGPTADGIRLVRKLQSINHLDNSEENNFSDTPIRIKKVRLLNCFEQEAEEIGSGERLIIEVTGYAREKMHGLNFGIEIIRADGVMAYDLNSRMDNYLPDVDQGEFVMRFELPKCDLVDGLYTVSAGIMDRLEHIHYHTLAKCAFFSVKDNFQYRGIARLEHTWSIQSGVSITR